MKTVWIPPDITELGDRLEHAGYEWYLVGGSVRDALLGAEPHDYDIATDATPEQMKDCLTGFRWFETGIRHGTLTVLTEERSVEVTTYRIDGEYKDARHPEGVLFSDSVTEDLARRDFTVNAMAYHPSRGLVDRYGGQADLRCRIIRCVRDPGERFREDALRILRALRFSATLGFSVEEETERAIREHYPLLHRVSAERIWSELKKLLTGTDAVRVLGEYKEVFFFLMPEMAPMDGWEQKNPYHIYDVWEHTLCAVAHTEPDLILRLAALWHDMGKPAVFSLDEAGIGHFYGHAKKSAESARNILNRMRSDHKTKTAILSLVEDHDRVFDASGKSLRRYASKTSLSHARRLLKLQKADVAAQSPKVREARLAALGALEEMTEEWEREDACMTLRDLAIRGSDVMALGVPAGKQVGELLSLALERVISGKWRNEKEYLLEKLRACIQ